MSNSDARMSSDASVGVIGGGPCGLMTALLLARAGARCVVFEKKPGSSVHPKAMAISRRTSELYRQLSLLEAIKNGALADNGRFLSIWAKSLVGEELGQVQYSAVPNELTPCIALHCPQTWTERVLLHAVSAEPLAEVKFNCEVLSILPQRDFVRLSLPAGEVFDVPWLVAADGAGSAIRHQLGVEADGPGDRWTIIRGCSKLVGLDGAYRNPRSNCCLFSFRCVYRSCPLFAQRWDEAHFWELGE